MASAGGPVLGVCLGHQLLFASSDEGPDAAGLALLDGHVARLAARRRRKVPHMGWNTLTTVAPGSRLLAGTAPARTCISCTRTPRCRWHADVAATTDYGESFAAAVEHDNIMGTQFHPEKSGAVGLRVYANFVAMCADVIVIPAIDVLGGRCVRLRQGAVRAERPCTTRIQPLVARRFIDAGATRIHVVDLDAARGRATAESAAPSGRIVAACAVARCDVEVGGGVRDADDCARAC